jgi:hypothetical protein
MWKRITNPDVLIYLHASFEVCTQRRRLDWNQADFAEQQVRLAHARQHADLIIATDALSPAEVLARATLFLAARPRQR